MNNTSGFDSGTITVTASSSLPARYGGSSLQPALGAGQSGRYCFNFNNHSMTGPAAVAAEAALPNVTLTTVSTDLEDRYNYGWVYCATIRNSSPNTSAFTLIAQSGLSSTSSFGESADFFPGDGTNPEACWPVSSLVPVAMAVTVPGFNVIVTIEGTGVENAGGSREGCMDVFVNGSAGVSGDTTLYFDEGF